MTRDISMTTVDINDNINVTASEHSDYETSEGSDTEGHIEGHIEGNIRDYTRDHTRDYTEDIRESYVKDDSKKNVDKDKPYNLYRIESSAVSISLKEYIERITSNVEVEDSHKEQFKKHALYTYRNMDKHLNFLESDKIMLLQNQRMLTLKYHVLKRKINFVQLSVIFVSAFIAFIEAIQQYVHVIYFFKTVMPIVASTYIGLIVAYARFYKWDELGETLTKINEKLAMSINELRKKMKSIRFYKELLPPPTNFQRYYDNINKELEKSRKDGTQDFVVQLKQEIDLLLNYREKLYYKNKLSHLKLQEVIVEQKLNTIERFKKSGDENKCGVQKYERKYYFPFNMCFGHTGSIFWTKYTQGDAFFDEQLYEDVCKSKKTNIGCIPV